MKRIMVIATAIVVLTSVTFAQEMVRIPGKDFQMSKTEVTQELYKSVMGDNPSYKNGDMLPVECVSWYDAILFCNKLSVKEGLTPVYSVNGVSDPNRWNYVPHKGNEIKGTIAQNTNASGYRLPSVEEWKYSAKGGKDYKYAGSDKLDEVGWSFENSDYKTHLVALKKANGYGLYDMSGNVWEWCWDNKESDRNNPRKIYSMICGGSCSSSSLMGDDERGCRINESESYSADSRFYYCGFRIVRSVTN